jgi:hypothetical protein
MTFTPSKSWAKISNDILEVSMEMPPWSAAVTDVFASKN